MPAIQELIRTFADRKLMIRRSLGELYESIREFLVQEVIKGTVRTAPVAGGRIVVTATDVWSRGSTPRR